MRPDVFDDIIELIRETIAEQDTILFGRKMYQEWSQYWPNSKIEPFATFINNHPKLVASSTPINLEWPHSTLLGRDLAGSIAAPKAQPGKSIGVHGSISLVQSLLLTGLLDELRFIQFPAIAGHGRRLLDQPGAARQLDLRYSKRTPTGLNYRGVHASAGIARLKLDNSAQENFRQDKRAVVLRGPCARVGSPE